MKKNNVLVLKENSVDNFKIKCSKIFLFLCVLIFALSIFINLSFSIAPVSGFSMYPTLNINGSTLETQDRVVLNYIKQYHKGDIIVAKKEQNSNEEYIYVIKRLIAVGGDRVEILKNGDVKVNGILLDEPYVNISNKANAYYEFMAWKSLNEENFEQNELIIKPGFVFYLGDNRSNSYDCSDYGPVKEENIVAKVDFIIKANENAFLSVIKQIFGGKKW